MTTINACPFCGYDDVEIDETAPHEYSVCCPECETVGPKDHDVNACIRGWNRRQQTAAALDLLRACQAAYDFAESFRADIHYDGDDLMGTLAAAINKAEQT